MHVKYTAKIKDCKRFLILGVKVITVLYLWCHVVCDAELQVCEDALHAVEGLLSGGSQVFLHGPGHGSKYGLCSLSWIHDLPGVFG